MHRLHNELERLVRDDPKIFEFLESNCLDGIWFWDLERPEEEWMSPTFWRTLGYDPAEKQHLAAEWQGIINADDLKLAISNVEAHCADPSSPYDQIVRYTHKSGSTVWVRCRGFAIRDESGKPIRLLGVHTDITEMKAQEQARKERDASEIERFSRFAKTLDKLERVAKIGSWEVDLINSKVIWSEQTRLIHEVPDDFEPNLESGIHFYEEGESRELITAAVQHAIETGVGWDLELPIITATNKRIWVRAQGEAEFEGGQCVRLFGVFQDISDRYAYEQELREANMIAERASALKSEFLANMSHEIRTPMNAVLGLSQILTRENHYPLEVVQHARKIVRAGQSLQGLLNDILDLSKIESGKLSLSPMPMRFSEIEQNLALLMSSSAQEKQIELIISPFSESETLFVADQMRIEQVLVNLLSNAIKFTDQGFVSLSIRALSGTSSSGSRRVECKVTDTGIGMSQEQTAKVLDPFSQADSSITRRFGGTGLGLTIAQRLLGLMDSSLTIVSEPGEGTSVSFVLELEVDPSEVTAERYDTAHKDSIGVLVVDDHDIARDAICETASAIGWEPTAVNGGADALLVYNQMQQENRSPDLILLDWMMPDINGLSVAREIKQRARAAGESRTPTIIMVTAYDQAQVEKSPDAQCVDLVLNKPVTAAALREARAALVEARSMSIHPPATSTSGRLAGKSLLVVDDNLFNRDVAKTIFEGEGAVVFLTEDGKQAINWLSRPGNRVDAVIMDVQMPVMDGLEATRALRSDTRFEGLPIIGMSAGAYQSDIDAALAAGMDAYITKPMNIHTAVLTLQQHLGIEVSLGQPGVAEQIERRQVSDNLLFDRDAALETFGNDSKVAEYLQRFLSEVGPQLPHQEMPLESLQKAALHRLKGTAASLHLKRLTKSLQTLEDKVIEDSLHTDDLLRFVAVWQETEADLRAFVKTHGPTTEPQIGVGVEQQPLTTNELCALEFTLESYNPDVVRVVLDPLLAGRRHPRLVEVRGAVDTFDFTRAGEIVQQLLKEVSV